MNIFALDPNPKIAATYHTDKHVVKMILETAQLLSTAHHLLDGQSEITPFIYKSTHKHHPCAVWVRKSSENYLWAYHLFGYLLQEFTYRYGKSHSSARLIPYLGVLPRKIPIGELTPFALAMPVEYKKNNPIESYRLYYNMAKRHLFGWKNRQVPEWITQQ